MPEWEDHAKLHDGCGGIVRWVEAIQTPGVGYYGECLFCGEEHIVVEDILPVRALTPQEASDIPVTDRRELEWDDDDTWRHNQKRLGQEVGV